MLLIVSLYVFMNLNEFCRIEFPYLVMLMSGGHCLLAVVQDVKKFLLLGTCLDTSPGDMLDKVSACEVILDSYSSNSRFQILQLWGLLGKLLDMIAQR